MNEDNKYINIKDVAEAKGLTSTRSLRLELNKIESKYISREIKVNGGTSYEILFSSLEPEIQRKLREAENKTTALVPHNYKEPDFVSDKTKLTANYRANIVVPTTFGIWRVAIEKCIFKIVLFDKFFKVTIFNHYFIKAFVDSINFFRHIF